MPGVVYAEGGREVRPGDRVTFRRWFRKVPATVAFVPGISPPHPHFEATQGVEDVGIRTDEGRVYGVYIDPETHVLRDIVVFSERGPEPDALPDELDDPTIPND